MCKPKVSLILSKTRSFPLSTISMLCFVCGYSVNQLVIVPAYYIIIFSVENALRRKFPDDAPIIIYQLRKEYPGSGGKLPHIAVHSLSLAIQRNECFGLLGPNGKYIYVIIFSGP